MFERAGAALKKRITITTAKISPMMQTITMSVRGLASSVGIFSLSLFLSFAMRSVDITDTLTFIFPVRLDEDSWQACLIWCCYGKLS